MLDGRGFEGEGKRKFQKRFVRKVFTPIFAPPIKKRGSSLKVL